MRRLNKTRKQIQDLIEAIEVSAERREAFIEVCTNLERAIGFNSAVLIPHRSPHLIVPDKNHLVLNGSTQDSQTFATHYAHQDRMFTDWMRHPKRANTVAQNTELWAAAGERLEDTEFYNDFLSRVPAYYVLGGLLQHRGVLAGFALHRTRRDKPFTEHHKNILNCLLPTLARTLYLIEAWGNGALAADESVETRVQRLGLTPREQDVVALVLGRHPNHEIASRLGVGEQTVKEHLQSILAKARVHNRHELRDFLRGLWWEKIE